MKWIKTSLYIIPVFLIVTGLSLFIIYGNRQNIKASEMQDTIPEIRYGHILNWDIKGKKQVESFKEMKDGIIAHYHLDEDNYKDRRYTDVFIYQGNLIISDKKFQNKFKHSKDYHFYAVDMNDRANPKYFKFEDPIVKRTYERLF